MREKKVSVICKHYRVQYIRIYKKNSSSSFRRSSFKYKMERSEIPQKLVYEKFYVHEIAAVNLSKLYFLKNAKKTCKPNNGNLNRD